MQKFKPLGPFQSRGPSDYVCSRVLLANVAERVTVPSTANFVVISGTSNLYVSFGGGGVTAAVPTDLDDGTASELNGASYYIDPATYTNISVISAVDSIATLAFYQV